MGQSYELSSRTTQSWAPNMHLYFMCSCSEIGSKTKRITGSLWASYPSIHSSEQQQREDRVSNKVKDEERHCPPPWKCFTVAHVCLLPHIKFIFVTYYIPTFKFILKTFLFCKYLFNTVRFIYAYECFSCLSIYHMHLVSSETRKGNQISFNWS